MHIIPTSFTLEYALRCYMEYGSDYWSDNPQLGEICGSSQMCWRANTKFLGSICYTICHRGRYQSSQTNIAKLCYDPGRPPGHGLAVESTASEEGHKDVRLWNWAKWCRCALGHWFWRAYREHSRPSSNGCKTTSGKGGQSVWTPIYDESKLEMKKIGRGFISEKEESAVELTTDYESKYAVWRSPQSPPNIQDLHEIAETAATYKRYMVIRVNNYPRLYTI